MSHYYDREGTPISLDEWCHLRGDAYERGSEYFRIAETTVGRWWISTVWLGLDHGLPGWGPPLIFETMVFDHGPDTVGLDRGLDWEMRRYTNEEQARQGHAEMVQLVTELEALND